jgi:hypothetical protein
VVGGSNFAGRGCEIRTKTTTQVRIVTGSGVSQGGQGATVQCIGAR